MMLRLSEFLFIEIVHLMLALVLHCIFCSSIEMYFLTHVSELMSRLGTNGWFAYSDFLGSSGCCYCTYLVPFFVLIKYGSPFLFKAPRHHRHLKLFCPYLCDEFEEVHFFFVILLLNVTSDCGFIWYVKSGTVVVVVGNDVLVNGSSLKIFFLVLVEESSENSKTRHNLPLFSSISACC